MFDINNFVVPADPGVEPEQIARPDAGCPSFAQARETACADPQLGAMWLQLFDDGDP